MFFHRDEPLIGEAPVDEPQLARVAQPHLPEQ